MYFFEFFIALHIAMSFALEEQYIHVCTQISSDSYNSNSLKENCSDQTVFIEENALQEDSEKMGKSEWNCIKGEKGETESMNQTEIQTIIDDRLLNISREIQNIETKLNEIETHSEPCMKYSRVPTNFFVEYCSVGMRYGDSRINDTDITASSVLNSDFKPSNGRLNYQGSENPLNHLVWAPGKGRTGEWIRVNLGVPTTITGVITQGRGDVLNTNQYVTSYKIAYGNTTNNMRLINDETGNPNIFSGNTEAVSYKMNIFSRPVTAQYFQLIVQSWNGYISLRMDYIVC